MEKVSIKLENCYGIRKLENEFDFSNRPAFIIYASNGSMKTSFAKTLKNISDKIAPKEEVFGRTSTYSIKNQDSRDLNPEEIFVIESYNENFYSKKLSNLLVNKSLKEEYDTLSQDILESKETFISQIKSTVGKKVTVDEECMKSFDSDNFLELLLTIYNDIDTREESGLDFSLVSYEILFDSKVEDFVKDPENIELLTEYGIQYDALVETSTFLQKGVFSQYNATAISSNLDSNGFFKAGHELLLSDGINIPTAGDFDKMIQDEKTTLLSDPALLKKFNQIDRKLSANASLRNFRIIIENSPELISKLANYDSFKRKSWISILKSEKTMFKNLVLQYKVAKQEIESIQLEAGKENEEWRHVVKIFSDRFFVPFTIEINNQEDVVLKNSIPVVSFKYREHDGEKEIERAHLKSVLSGGEKRALYLLDVIFELEALKKNGKKILVVVDDIAESFDYKNKYSIIEYLMDHYSHNMFNFIILTHNFDFYRTVGSRMLNFNREHCVMAITNEGNVEIECGRYLKNVFSIWKDSFDKNDIMLLASIPFIRNIVEYIDSTCCTNYMFLTKLLHIINYADGSKTKDITLKELETVINEVWKTEKIISKNREAVTVYSLIIDKAKEISSNPNADEMNLESKIVLSMAIRLMAENFMIKSIVDICGSDDKIESISSNQTGELLRLYKECIGVDGDMLPILEQVSLMTAENIHLNSFMYEPLIDISMQQLKSLCGTLLMIPE